MTRHLVSVLTVARKIPFPSFHALSFSFPVAALVGEISLTTSCLTWVLLWETWGEEAAQGRVSKYGFV